MPVVMARAPRSQSLVQIRLSSADHAAWSSAARQRKQTLSGFIRTLIRAEIGMPDGKTTLDRLEHRVTLLERRVNAQR